MLHCPFCASDAVMKPFQLRTHERPHSMTTQMMRPTQVPSFVQCSSCGASTKLYDTPEQAWAAWNRRTVPLTLPATKASNGVSLASVRGAS